MRSHFTALFLSLILACGAISCRSDGNKNENPPAKKPGQVCCEIFGYGSRMKKCCQRYEWTERDRCRVPAKFVGGGRAVVSDSLCEKQR